METESKMRRLPSSPHIHQKYIYMWNNSYRHLLNAGRRPQTSKKARKSPHNWVGQKKKGKKDKGIGTGPAPMRGSCEGGKFSAH